MKYHTHNLNKINITSGGLFGLNSYIIISLTVTTIINEPYSYWTRTNKYKVQN